MRTVRAMASLDLSSLESFIMDMEEIARIPDSVTSDMLNAGADVLVEATKASARSMGVTKTGLTASSVKKTKITKKDTEKKLFITFGGSRTRNGIKTRNAEIAFINEYGKRGQPARPFVRTANEKSADNTVNAMESVYDDYLKSKNL